MRTQLAFIAQNDLPGIEDDARFCQEFGFEGLEYNYWADFDARETEYFKKIQAIQHAYGIRCVMLGIWGWNPIAPEPGEREKARAQLERAVEFARILEAQVLTMNAGRFGDDLERNVAEFAGAFSPILRKLEDSGITPAFYALHGNTFLNDITAYEKLWETVPGALIKYDPANWRHAGKDYLDVVRRHGDKIAHVHIKEHLYHAGTLASQPPAGMGDIQWGKVFAFLYEHHYDRALSIEPHGPVWSRGDMRLKMLRLTQRFIAPFLIE